MERRDVFEMEYKERIVNWCRSLFEEKEGFYLEEELFSGARKKIPAMSFCEIWFHDTMERLNVA